LSCVICHQFLSGDAGNGLLTTDLGNGLSGLLATDCCQRIAVNGFGERIERITGNGLLSTDLGNGLNGLLATDCWQRIAVNGFGERIDGLLATDDADGLLILIGRSVCELG
jgi:hypothetical protein